VEAELASGNLERAEQLVQRAEAAARDVELRVPSAISMRARDALLLARGEAASAAALAQESAAIAETVGARIEAGRSHLLAGRALAEAEDRADAVALLHRAERELDRCGAAGHRDDARRELRRLGVPTEPPGPSRLARTVLANLFGELHNLRGEALQAALARALGDPSLVVVHAGPDGALPALGGDRSVAIVERDGRQFAALVYDASRVEAPELVEAVCAAAAIALENDRLHVESQARLAELQASRERIVSAGDAERRRLERNLHDGAQQRLVALAMQLRLIQANIRRDPSSAEALVASATDQLAESLAELRELARGIHPAGLNYGLGPALESLAARSTVPTAVTSGVPDRLADIGQRLARHEVRRQLDLVGQIAASSSRSPTTASAGPTQPAVQG
jgi:signal transduction histidine kinase